MHVLYALDHVCAYTLLFSTFRKVSITGISAKRLYVTSCSSYFKLMHDDIYLWCDRGPVVSIRRNNHVLSKSYTYNKAFFSGGVWGVCVGRKGYGVGRFRVELSLLFCLSCLFVCLLLLLLFWFLRYIMLHTFSFIHSFIHSFSLSLSLSLSPPPPHQGYTDRSDSPVSLLYRIRIKRVYFPVWCFTFGYCTCNLTLYVCALNFDASWHAHWQWESYSFEHFYSPNKITLHEFVFLWLPSEAPKTR